MKLQQPENPNYVATVVRLKTINDLEGMDNVVGASIFGFQAIIKKGTPAGEIGIFFAPETQLSEEFARENNLFRHGDLNKDESASGYLEDNRRIKAMKFRGHRSSGLFLSLESLKWTGINIDELNEGDSFDSLNGHQICTKFMRKKAGVPRTERNKEKKFVRVDEKFLPMHYDSENYFKNKHHIKGNRRIVVTQKLHGTSIRIGNTSVLRKLTAIDKIARFLGAHIQEKEFDHVFGSRKVIKDINNPNQNHFYGTDVYTEEGSKASENVPENFIIYGELIGWISPGSAIQKNYTYRIDNGERKLFVYRVALVTNQGRLVDLSWDQVKEFCRDKGFNHVPELYEGLHRNFKVEKFLDTNYFKDGFKNAVPLDDESPCDEGVCIRVDGLAPYILKAKSPKFFEHETNMIDRGVEDIEAEESITDEQEQLQQ